MNNLAIKNPDLNIKSISDSSFKRYGRILDSSSFESYYEYLESHTMMPQSENQYVAHDPLCESFIKDQSAILDVFGHVKVQFGYVNGYNSKLNALEYHKSSEINLCLTPLILFLAKTSDLDQENHIHSSKLDVFYVPKHTTIEIFSQTLHFSPCKVSDQGFKCGVLLPYGTNMEFVKSISNDTMESKLLFKTNKWLLAHIEHQRFIDLGAFVGIDGKNLEIKY